MNKDNNGKKDFKDPFEEDGAPKDAERRPLVLNENRGSSDEINNANGGKKKKGGNAATPAKKTAVSAVLAAIAGVMIIITGFTPLSFSLITVAALCYYIAHVKCGLVYGLLTIAASLLISGFVIPDLSALFMTVIIFAPYSLLCFFIRKIKYNNLRNILIRIIISLIAGAVFYTAGYFSLSLLAVSIIKIGDIISAVGAAGLGGVFVLIYIIFDFMFYGLSERITALIKNL